MIRDDERVVGLEHDLMQARRARDMAAAEAELRRKFHIAEVREVIRLSQMVDHLEEELTFVRDEIGHGRFDELVEKYHALNDAALRRATGYSYTKGEHAA